MMPRQRAAEFPRALAALGLVLCLLGVFGCTRPPEAPRAEKGLLDLSGWSFQANGPAALNGEWEFLWGGRDDPARTGALAFDGRIDFYPVPSLWRAPTALGGPVLPHGRAMYRLRVRLDPDSGPKSLYLAGVLSVCRVWVDGRLAGANGEIPDDQASESPREHIILPRFTPAANPVEIVLEVSNHINVQGGLNTHILLGEPEQIDRLALTRWITGALIAGVLLAMGAYHLIVFFVRRSDKGNLFFGLFAFAWSLATLFSPASGFLMSQVTALPWRWHIDLALLPYGFTIPLMVIFYHALFPKRFGRWVNGFYCVLGAAYVVYLLLTPPHAFGPVSFAYYLATRTAYLYLFGAFVADILQRRRGVAILAPGYLALAYAELSKILCDLHVTNSAAFAPYGMLVFILSYSVFMSMRFSWAFLALEENASLKREVDLRRKTEQDLRLRQLRLSKMLDAMDEAVFAVNQSREIAFCNQAFEALTGRRAQEILGQPLTLLLHAPQAPQARAMLEALDQLLERGGESLAFQAVELAVAKGGRAVPCRVYATSLELEDEPLLLLSLRPGAGDGEDAQLPAAMLRTVEGNRQRLQRLEETMLALEAGEAKAAVLEDLRAINTLFDKLGDRLNDEGQGESARQLAPQVMNAAVACWTQATGQGKGELAAQSGLWNVYMERDGYLRTQTLDRYLSEETLPQRPRWRQVFATAEFVLAACPDGIPCRRELQNYLERLRHMG